MASKRLALGAAWLVAGFAGGFLAIVLRVSDTMPLPLALVVGNLPSALVLAVAARRPDWGAVYAIGWLALVLLNHFATYPVLSQVMAPLGPTRTFTHIPQESDYLPIRIALLTSFGLVEGGLAAGLLWFQLRSRLLWTLLWGAGGLLTAVSVQARLLLPVPGQPGTGLYVLGPLLDAAALALVWRFDAILPALQLPRLSADFMAEAEPEPETER